MKHCLNELPSPKKIRGLTHSVPEDLQAGVQVRCMKSYYHGYKEGKVYTLIHSYDDECLVLDNHLTGWDAEWELVSIFTGKEEITDWL